jgi:hypothetical protein
MPSKADGVTFMTSGNGSGGVIARAFANLLIAVHVFLGGWAMVGFLELFLASVPWPQVSNPLFTRSMLLLQWALIGLCSVTYLVGYATRWRHTPGAMRVVYSAMALVCAYQTFFVLTHDSRFLEMAIEYAEYVVISLFLFHSRHMRARFAR